ncbi:HAD family hydrolase [Aureimonas sp. AU40]|uniref:HAD family hydrolase n=1 Tax=Aureimonas sp. AU40 TaxID=1637747 RepID=UPI000784BFFB|nr:HAD family hydrolase [Aureimonas sp. AU40]
MSTLTTIGFDADDTLWQNETFFRLTEQRFVDLLAEHGDAAVIGRRLLDTEKRNLEFYGFGIKGFTLSMIETAIQLTEGRAPARLVEEILGYGREMLRHPVETLPDARETLKSLSGEYRLVLITKGDLFDQERKLAASRLGDLFHAVEIVSDKTEATYARIFARHGDGPERAMMVGNSLRSDVLPALAAGSWGVHMPHELTWEYEHAEAPLEAPRFRRIDGLADLPALIRSIGG